MPKCQEAPYIGKKNVRYLTQLAVTWDGIGIIIQKFHVYLELAFKNSDTLVMTGGRPKQFDEQEALQAAMEIFWRQGFEGTSCDDLLTAMNIRCGSMYSTFGDKKALYEKAFDLYQQTEFENALKILNGPGSPLENVRTLVRCWGEAMSQPDCKGCLVSNTLIEFGSENETKGIAKRARDLVATMRTTFAEKLAVAKQQGELADEVNEEELAAFLVTSAQGLSVLARAGVDKETLQGAVNTILHTLR